MSQDDKIQALFSALWPLIKTKIEQEFKLDFKPRKRLDTGKRKTYIPEIDWMILNYKIRGEVRHCKFDGQGKLTASKIPPMKQYYCSGASGLQDGVYVNHIYIPTKTLSQLDTLYGLMARVDYRVHPASTIYMGGVLDNRGAKITGGASCYTINMAEPITKEIINNTRMEWKTMPDEQLNTRLVRYPVMMELLDILEQEQITAEQQADLWRIYEDNVGNIYDLHDAQMLDDNDARKLNPKEIVPTWMEDSVPN